MPCGFEWTTTTTGKTGPDVHQHRCAKPSGHASTMHACVVDGGAIHVVEFRLAAPAERLTA